MELSDILENEPVLRAFSAAFPVCSEIVRVRAFCESSSSFVSKFVELGKRFQEVGVVGREGCKDATDCAELERRNGSALPVVEPDAAGLLPRGSSLGITWPSGGGGRAECSLSLEPPPYLPIQFRLRD